MGFSKINNHVNLNFHYPIIMMIMNSGIAMRETMRVFAQMVYSQTCVKQAPKG